MGLFDRFRKNQQTEYHPNPALHAYTGKKPYIFISYAHADASVVMPEISRLNELGYNVWFDEGIFPSNKWNEELCQALNKCELFLVFLTPNSAASKNVANEIYYALETDKKFLSVYLKNADLSDGLKLSIRSKQAILKYLMNDSEYVYKLTKALNNMNIYRNNRDPE